MEKKLGPAFNSATGYTFSGFSAGSTALATEIKSKVHQGDVFISASPSVNAGLEGAANGNWVSWYVTFAKSPLVLGYNRSSKFANDIKTKPWYQVITEPGVLVGRTDPATDPKGKLTATAIAAAAKQYNDPALSAVTSSTSNVFPEETLVGRLQAGQLDVGFFYSSEATTASIPTVPVTVPGESFKATYTVTVLSGAPNESGAEAFVAYLLGPQGQAALRADGFELTQPPTVSGSGLPSSVQSALSGS
jgi:molybdate/tungstate transport system substrate-binding protein